MDHPSARSRRSPPIPKRTASTPLLDPAAAAPRAPAAKEGAPYQSIRPHLSTFDVIYFHGDWPSSRLIMAVEEVVNGSGAGEYSHIGLVIRGDAFPSDSPLYTPPGPDNAAYIFEAQDSKADGVANVHGTFLDGVQLRDLDRVAAAYDAYPGTKLAWCPMRKDRRPPTTAGWPAAYARYDGHLYDWPNLGPSAFCCLRPLRWLFRCGGCCGCCCTGRGCCDRCGCRDNAASRQICSELVAFVFKDLGIIPRDVDAENVIPSDFLTRPGNALTTFDSDGEVPVLFESPVRFTTFPKPGAGSFDGPGCGCDTH